MTTTAASPLACLRSIPGFDSLTDAQLQPLLAHMTRQAFLPGTVLFLEGEAPAGVWMVERGHVKVYKVGPEGAEYILRIVGPGESFNEIPPLDGGLTAANTATLDEVSLFLLPGEVLRAAIEADHALALQVIHTLAAQVRLLVRRVEDLALYTVTERLARYLVARSDNGGLNTADITRAAIASYLATTPETVSRSLRVLEESGAIRYDRQRVTICDAPLLRTLARL